MPLYEYQCENCGNRFERIQSIHDEPIKQCPNCSSNKIFKVIHAAGLVFKGSGWYVNDSRKSTSPAKPASDSTESTETKTESSETKTESKETKAEPKVEPKAEPKTEPKKEIKKESTESK